MKTALIISMVFAILLALFTGSFTWIKLNQIRKKANRENFTSSYQNAWSNEKHGEVLWNLKSVTKNPLQDKQLVYVISTIFRNNYKSTCLVGFETEYESNNLQTLARQTIDCQSYDLLLINHHFLDANNFTNYLENLNSQGMVMVVNSKKRHQISQKTFELCQKNDLKFNHEKIGRGIIVIAK